MRQISHNLMIGIIFFLCRLIMIASTSLDGITGYGDFTHFFHLAQMGVPFIDIWVEFPPLFPLFSWMIYHLASGQEHVYGYLILIVLSVFQAGSLIIFAKLVKELHPKSNPWIRIGAFFIVSLILPYNWWFFDACAVFMLLLGVWWLIKGKDYKAIFALAIGALIKLFPAIALCIVWRYRPIKQAMIYTILLVLIVVGVYGAFYLAAPDNTLASISSQSSKGSWESIWALIDGNYRTGNFGPENERLNPSAAYTARGNPARISPWITLVFFLGLGVYIFWQMPEKTQISQIKFLSLSMLVFFLWMPGWSPQWVLFLIPVILLIFDEGEGIVISLIMIMINLLEWPILLSRGLVWGLWITIPFRTILFGFLVFLIMKRNKDPLFGRTGEINSGTLEYQ